MVRVGARYAVGNVDSHFNSAVSGFLYQFKKKYQVVKNSTDIFTIVLQKPGNSDTDNERKSSLQYKKSFI